MGSSIRYASPSSGIHRRVGHSAAFHLGDSRRYAHDYARSWQQSNLFVYPVDEVPQHTLHNFEVRDDAVLERTDSHDIGRSSANHALRFGPDSQNAFRALVDSHDGGL